jgi:hypothetical protein
VVAHFRDEARREGKQFPEEGSPAFRQTRNRLLGLLVYRTELEQAARRLGVSVSDDDVPRRLPAQSGEERDLAGDSFALSTGNSASLKPQVFRFKLTPFD